MDISTAVSTGQDLSGILAWILAYLLAITVFFFVIHLIIAYLVYRDAKDQNMSAFLWALAIVVLPVVFYFLGIFFYIVAVLVVAVAYAIARSNKGGYRSCAKYSKGKCVKWN